MLRTRFVELDIPTFQGFPGTRIVAVAQPDPESVLMVARFPVVRHISYVGESRLAVDLGGSLKVAAVRAVRARVCVTRHAGGFHVHAGRVVDVIQVAVRPGRVGFDPGVEPEVRPPATGDRDEPAARHEIMALGRWRAPAPASHATRTPVDVAAGA